MSNSFNVYVKCIEIKTCIEVKCEFLSVGLYLDIVLW